MKKIILALLLLFEFLNAQSFTASVNNTTISEGEPFEVNFIFEGSDINSLANFAPPGFGGLKIISGPNQSTSMQIINGNVSASRTLSYILVAPSVGKYTIGSASIDFKGQRLKTEPIQITAVKGSPKPKEEKPSSEVNLKEISDNLFIRAVVDKNRAYIGEQITLTYKLYTRLNIAAQMSISKLPQYVGFWSEEIETARTLSFTTEIVEGKRFNVAVLKKVALFPTQSGKLEVTPFELTVPIAIRKNRNLNNFWDSFFDDPFNRQEIYEYQAKSNVLKIDVIPLPENDKPSNFSGAVGKYNISASIDKETVKVNEPLNLKLKISGNGNIALLQMPRIDFPVGFENYEPKVSEDISRVSKISGLKTYEYLLIPRAAGIREIKPIEFSYFDPDAKKYFTVSTAGFKIDIQKSDSAVTYYSAEKEEIKTLGTDIRANKSRFQSLRKDNDLLINSFYFWLAVILPVLGFIGIIYRHNYYNKISSDLKTFNYLRAEKIAKKRLKKSLKFLNNNQIDEFYTEIAQALFGYLENKLDINKSDFTLSLAENKLNELGVNQELVQKMKLAGEKCEFIRFAPNADKNSSMQEFYNEILNLIIEIEKEVKS